ncbi:Muskelin 1, intracellular mediator containing kelch motif [Quaeritorhiza haematococci]|nr:Muskelin 1, intracellular mediator containing kelch motif [Quaeritorhiza haematococci]
MASFGQSQPHPFKSHLANPATTTPSPFSTTPQQHGTRYQYSSQLPHRIQPHLPAEKIGYDIHASSSHSASYHARNIMVNKPTDQSSRWSSGSNNQTQYITIKLDKMAIVRILFN